MMHTSARYFGIESSPPSFPESANRNSPARGAFCAAFPPGVSPHTLIVQSPIIIDHSYRVGQGLPVSSPHPKRYEYMMARLLDTGKPESFGAPIRSTQPHIPRRSAMRWLPLDGGLPMQSEGLEKKGGYKPSGYVVKESRTVIRLPICAQGLRPPNITLAKIHTVKTIVAHESALSVKVLGPLPFALAGLGKISEPTRVKPVQQANPTYAGFSYRPCLTGLSLGEGSEPPPAYAGSASLAGLGKISEPPRFLSSDSKPTRLTPP